jgi:hypothetical protein
MRIVYIIVIKYSRCDRKKTMLDSLVEYFDNENLE